VKIKREKGGLAPQVPVPLFDQRQKHSPQRRKGRKEGQIPVNNKKHFTAERAEGAEKG